MFYIPSPIEINYDYAYQAMANRSGRMQYYKSAHGQSRQRIGRADFIYAFNNSNIVALRPIPSNSAEPVFQLEFLTRK